MIISIIDMKAIAMCLLLSMQSGNSMNSKSLKIDGFQLEWEHLGEKVKFSLTAPCSGWVAIGFTETGQLIGSNLIQGNVIDGKSFIQDQYITGFGEHPPVEALAVESRISEVSGSEEDGKTRISFSILAKKIDKLHCDLPPGGQISVWLAYSVSDDFSHHSRKRILQKITL